MIEVKNLVKKYGNHVAVDHLNFTVERGKIYGFLGPNGAGKSTTMNIMTGYLGATEGKVLIDGHDILEEPEIAKRSIGYLPEIPPLYMDMTVGEYLQFSAELKKIPKYEREESIGQVVELTKLDDVKGRLIKNLSKGYKQRVGLAQAILGMPEIIILDEPTVGLDPKQIIEIRELIRELSREHTVILSSHILAEVREVCDYIMIISKGKMVASDTPENLENLLAGTETVKLEVRGKDSDVLKILNGMKQVSQWKCREIQGGNLEIEIQTATNEDIREELFYAFAEAKCPILAMTKTKASLEKIFLELTEEDHETKSKKKPKAEEFEEDELEAEETEDDTLEIEESEVEESEVEESEAEESEVEESEAEESETEEGGEEDAGDL